MSDFDPHVIWGVGDTAYSDGTKAVDFSNQVYGRHGWERQPGCREWLRNEYRRMYRHFWSLPDFASVLRRFRHIFMWDDHEIHDGWGSEGIDMEECNRALFQVAREVAEEFILGSGPRLRPGLGDAHMAYRLGPMAAFITDTRTSRNYEAASDRLISRKQFTDLGRFLDRVTEMNDVTDVVLCTTVPFINLRSFVERCVANGPIWMTSIVGDRLRDDVRDSWSSPGNHDTLSAVLRLLASFSQARSDVRLWNVSGDIHVASAFEITPPGARRPIIQVTTSALTNRVHPSEFVLRETEIDDDTDMTGVGHIRRLWPTVTDPNMLFMRIGRGGADFTLKTWNRASTGLTELRLHG